MLKENAWESLRVVFLKVVKEHLDKYKHVLVNGFRSPSFEHYRIVVSDSVQYNTSATTKMLEKALVRC